VWGEPCCRLLGLDGLFYGKYELIYIEVEPPTTLHDLCTCFCFRVRVINVYLLSDCVIPDNMHPRPLFCKCCGNCSRSFRLFAGIKWRDMKHARSSNAHHHFSGAAYSNPVLTSTSLVANATPRFTNMPRGLVWQNLADAIGCDVLTVPPSRRH